ncbi:MAG TPA: response regulator transcription factor [Terriglobales bacterium]|jgi:DNA-binding response OmpR family regulator|nr:response regulator transcription factor [Terriglobales bacterium]
MRVLIIEEDGALADFLTHALATEHHEVEACHSYQQTSPKSSDLIVLDINASAQGGIRVIRAIRCQAPSVFLIGLGTRLASKDLVALLDAGADDYLIKPFSFAELSARIRALRRRSRRTADTELKIADLNMDRVCRRVERAGRTIELTTKEFSLLEFLMLNAGRRVSRAEILQHVWKTMPCPGSTNLVDVYVAYIRKKIDGDSPHKLIRTTRGVGYEISAPENVDSCRDLQHA